MPYISQKRYDELLEKETRFEEFIAARRRGAAKANALSPEELSARNKKASAARWAKYRAEKGKQG